MKRFAIIFLICVLGLSRYGSAQKQVGDTSLDLNGNLQVGYNDEYTNYAGSTHGLDLGGMANLTGSYYSPSFISFAVSPFYNQSRANSDSGAISDASGVAASASLFGGSRFPGSVNYSTTFNGTGNYGIPGIAAYDTHGNSQQFGVNWGEHVEGWPSLNVNFANGSNNYSVYGLSTQGSNSNDLFSAQSLYRVSGFNLNGSFEYTSIHSEIPQVASTEPLQSNSSGNSFSVGAGHNLPFNGNLGLGFTRGSFHSVYDGYNYDTTYDTSDANVYFLPAKNLGVGANVSYTNDLFGSIFAPLVGSGTPITGTTGNQSSNALAANSYVNYDIPKWYLHLWGGFGYQQQTYLGNSFSNEVFTQSASESRPLFGGLFNATLSVTESSLSTTSGINMGFNSLASYSRQVGRWNVSGNGSYFQSLQTALLGYTTSGFSAGGNVGYQINSKSYWSANATIAKSLLTNMPGTTNTSQSYSTSLSLPRVSVSGSYSVASGVSLLTSGGLVPTPLPPGVIPPSLLVYFNGSSYSVGLGATPIHGLTISGVYAKSLSNTLSVQAKSNNNNANAYIYATYRIRQLYMNAGWSKINQGFSASGMPPTSAGEIYFGISRWFNFF